jgi:hypothetical protein
VSEPPSVVLAAFFDHAARAADANERRIVDPISLFETTIADAVAAVNGGRLPPLSALDAEQATRMIERTITGRCSTVRDVARLLHAIAEEVSP